MNNISEILQNINHRPYPMPAGSWQYYQEWNRVIFLHYEVQYETLRKLVPSELTIDNHEGKYYVSIVPFSMEKIRPKSLPAFSPISNFHEINVRTYININGYSGVYFLNIEAEKFLSTILAKSLSGLPYEKSTIRRTFNTYTNINNKKNLSLDLQFHIGEKITEKTSLDKWLTERYCLFLQHNSNMLRYDIHHVEWPLYNIDFLRKEIQYSINDLQLADDNFVTQHYSPGIQVLSWNAVII